MITEKRLQEIRTDLERDREENPQGGECEYDYETGYSLIDELITAIEAAWAELAGRKESNLRYRRQVNERENKLQDLHKQHKAALAEIKRVRVKGGYREMYHDALHRWNEESVGLTERLENMWAEWGECKKQLDASHAINDVYKNMVGILELTIELLETNGGK